MPGTEATALRLLVRSWELEPEASGQGRASNVLAAIFHDHGLNSEFQTPPDPAFHRIGLLLEPFAGRLWFERRVQISNGVPAGFSVVVPQGTQTRALIEGEWRLLHMFMPQELLKSTSEAARAPLIVTKPASHDPVLMELGTAMRREIQWPDPFSQLAIDSIGSQLAVHLLRSYSADARPIKEPGALPGIRLKRSIEFLRAHQGDQIRLADVAAAAGLSPYHFCRAFTAAMGMPPARYLRKLRIHHAEQLLAATPVAIDQIATGLGYRNAAAFSRAFKRETGLSPRAFRARAGR